MALYHMGAGAVFISVMVQQREPAKDPRSPLTARVSVSVSVYRLACTLSSMLPLPVFIPFTAVVRHAGRFRISMHRRSR